jgi:hypothetical protein
MEDVPVPMPMMSWLAVLCQLAKCAKMVQLEKDGAPAHLGQMFIRPPWEPTDVLEQPVITL